MTSPLYKLKSIKYFCPSMKNNPISKSYLSFVLGIMLIALFLPLVTSSTTYKYNQNNNVDLKINCFDNISAPCQASVSCRITILYPNASSFIKNQSMTYNGIFYNYTLTSAQTSVTGVYNVVVACAGTTNGFTSYDFEIVPAIYPSPLSNNTISFSLIIFVISCLVIGFGFWLKDPVVTTLGSFGLVFFGLYTILYGIVGIRNMSYTWAIGLITLGLAAYIIIRSGYEIIVE